MSGEAVRPFCGVDETNGKPRWKESDNRMCDCWIRSTKRKDGQLTEVPFAMSHGRNTLGGHCGAWVYCELYAVGPLCARVGSLPARPYLVAYGAILL
jgi:hypothetical protein